MAEVAEVRTEALDYTIAHRLAEFKVETISETLEEA